MADKKESPFAAAERERLAFWRSLTKTQWIAAARAALPRWRVPGYSAAESCEVCGMSSDISQFHHVLPLEDQFDRGFVTPAQYPSAWLCPNHHAMVHKFMGFADFRKVVSIIPYGLTPAQADKIYKLIEQAREPHRLDGSREAPQP